MKAKKVPALLRVHIWLVALALTLPCTAAVEELEPPRPVNANEMAIDAAGLHDAVKKLRQELDEPAWLGYAVPMIDGDLRVCCARRGSHGTARRCSLGQWTSIAIDSPSESEPVTGAENSLAVFLRIEQGAVGAVRVFDGSCTVVAGGEDYYALSGVTGAESVRLLSSIAEGGSEDAAEGALAALGLQAGDQATGALIELAREHELAERRSHALFWLSQRAGERAAPTIRQAIDEDPDAEVREHAVFALGQLPADEAIPLLIDLARTNRYPQVRRAAFFWLGQTDDPRAVDFFEEVLAD
jgi:HEAT repeat protein